MSTTNPKRIWDRQHGESRQAYLAFCAYRDLGPARSIDRAFASLNPGVKRKGRPAEYFQWSSKYEWVRRTSAFDTYAEEVQRREFEARLKQLAHDQADFAVSEFQRLVERVRKADRILDKADAHPITDIEVIEEENGKRKRKKIGGINFSGYAALMKEIRESARRAILGPRDDAEPNTPADPAEDIEWEKPGERAA